MFSFIPIQWGDAVCRFTPVAKGNTRLQWTMQQEGEHINSRIKPSSWHIRGTVLLTIGYITYTHTTYMILDQYPLGFTRVVMA